jgi:hypothetical protein
MARVEPWERGSQAGRLPGNPVMELRFPGAQQTAEQVWETSGLAVSPCVGDIAGFLAIPHLNSSYLHPE